MYTVKSAKRVCRQVKGDVERGWRWSAYKSRAGGVVEVSLTQKIKGGGLRGYSFMTDQCTVGLLNAVGKFLLKSFPKKGRVIA